MPRNCSLSNRLWASSAVLVNSLIFLAPPARCGQQIATTKQLDTGVINLDVVVTPQSGAPISGLEQRDFTILDNKVPQTITSFRALRGREKPN